MKFEGFYVNVQSDIFFGGGTAGRRKETIENGMNTEVFGKYLAEAFGPGRAGRILEALEESPSVSVRFNPGKPEAELSEVAALSAGSVPWCGDAMFLSRRPTFTLDPVFHAGGYYVQDSSSMFVGYVFRQIVAGAAEREAGMRTEMGTDGRPGIVSESLSGRRSGRVSDAIPGRVVRVLDLCAAPGGKTTDLAAALRGAFGDRFFLVSNEVMKARAAALADNAARWGDPNVTVTSADPAAFAALEGFFDIILADVPCSGEGMFRKDPEAVRQWSEETVALCAARQRRILADVWPALSDGGVLIYSTCTFNRIENDDNVEWAARELGAEVATPDCPFEEVIRTRHGFSLVPGFVRGEGQYCAVLRKNENAGETEGSGAGEGSDRMEGYGTDGSEKLEWPDGGHYGFPDSHRPDKTGWRDIAGGKISGGVGGRTDGRTDRGVVRGTGGGTDGKKFGRLFTTGMSFRRKGELAVAVPEIIAGELDVLESRLKPLSAGVAVGVEKGGKLVPSADLALSTALDGTAFPKAEVSRETALAFLHRDSISLDGAPTGVVAVAYRGLNLGFVKNIGTRCNNLLPPHRRIMMDIPE